MGILAWFGMKRSLLMISAVYPGSFDPITNGHLDIIERGSVIFDELIVAVLCNPDKKGAFAIDERVDLINRSIVHLKNVKVLSYGGLLINLLREINCRIILRGLRAVSDFENEFSMALMNDHLAPEIETMFMMTSMKHLYLRSSSIKELAYFGGDLKDLVPDAILYDVEKRLKK